jgi:hypothetical protein
VTGYLDKIQKQEKRRLARKAQIGVLRLVEPKALPGPRSLASGREFPTIQQMEYATVEAKSVKTLSLFILIVDRGLIRHTELLAERMDGLPLLT